MMKRAQVFRLINAERAIQDAACPPGPAYNPSISNPARDLTLAPDVLALREMSALASNTWVNTTGSSLPTLQEVLRIAAFAVRILEHAAGSEELVKAYLR